MSASSLTNPHLADESPFTLSCPAADCTVEGSIPGIRRHLSHTHGMDKTSRDALVNSTLTETGNAHRISAAKRVSEGGKLATAVHWADTLPDERLRPVAIKLGLFLRKDTPRDELIAAIKDRAAKRGIVAVPAAS
jgi:transposase